MTEIATGFRAIDQEADAGRFVAYLDAQSANKFWQLRKRESIDSLRLLRGAKGLDVGCGLGDEVRTIASEVGDRGVAIGVDASKALISESQMRTLDDTPARFVVADGHALPFQSNIFDGARTERTLQHVAEPSNVLREMARVLKAGGRLAAIEPDWDTLVIDAEPLNLTRMFCRGWTEGVRHPNIGRELVGLASHAGFVDIEVWPTTWLIPSFEVADQQFSISEMAERVVDLDRATTAEAQLWFHDVRSREEHREFFAAVTYFFVTARKTS